MRNITEQNKILINMARLEFIAKITTQDGREIQKQIVEDIPDKISLNEMDGFLTDFDEYERAALKARNCICEDITQAWLDEQAKKGG